MQKIKYYIHWYTGMIICTIYLVSCKLRVHQDACAAVTSLYLTSSAHHSFKVNTTFLKTSSLTLKTIFLVFDCYILKDLPQTWCTIAIVFAQAHKGTRDKEGKD